MNDAFPSTRWSLLAKGQVALGELYQLYREPLRAYLVRTGRAKPQDVDDLLQGFFADRMIGQGLVDRFNAERGRFRSFLMVALNHFVIDTHRKQSAQRRAPKGSQSLEPMEDYHGSQAPPDADVFDVEWARRVVAEVLNRSETYCRDTNRGELWEILQSQVLSPMLHGEAKEPYGELVARLNLQSPAQASNLLITAKRMMRRMTRQVVSEYCRDEADVDGEVQALIAILSESSAHDRSDEDV